MPNFSGLMDMLAKSAPDLYANMIEAQSSGTFDRQDKSRHLYKYYLSKNGRFMFCYTSSPLKPQEKTKFRRWAAFIYKNTKMDKSRMLTKIVYTASKKTAMKKAQAWSSAYNKREKAREVQATKQELSNIEAFYHLQQVDEVQHRVVKKLSKVRYTDGTEKRITYKELSRLTDQVPTIEPEHLHLLMVLHNNNGKWVKPTGEVIA